MPDGIEDIDKHQFHEEVNKHIEEFKEKIKEGGETLHSVLAFIERCTEPIFICSTVLPCVTTTLLARRTAALQVRSELWD